VSIEQAWPQNWHLVTYAQFEGSCFVLRLVWSTGRFLRSPDHGISSATKMSAAPSFGRRRTGERDQLRLGDAIEDAFAGGIGRVLALLVNAGSTRSSTERWRVRAIVSMLVSKRRGDLAVAPAAPAAEASACSGMRAFSRWRARALLLDQRVELLAFVVVKLHNVLLDGRLFRGLPEASTQRSAAGSTCEALVAPWV
jgi:hypothetical protein